MLILFECTVGSIVLIAAAVCLLKLFRVQDPHVERDVWRAVLAASIAMPVLLEVMTLRATTVRPPEWLVDVQVLAPSVAVKGVSAGSIVSWIVIAVAALLLLRHMAFVIKWWRVWRKAELIHVAAAENSSIRSTAELAAPATVFSTVLVPKDFSSWSPEKRRFVIAHEQAHVRNKDFYVQWLAHLHRCVFWFNPLAWWLASRLSLLSEHVSDQAAVGESSERAEYATLLLGFARSVHEPMVGMARAKSLAARVERILRNVEPVRPRTWKSALAVVGLVPVVVLAASVGSVTKSFAANVVFPKSDPSMPVSHPTYPHTSRMLGEQGTVVLKLRVIEDGTVADGIVDRSSGYPDLDTAALTEALRWRLAAGTVNQEPAPMWGQFAVTFKLTPESSL